jgi:hypothetical protein
MGPSISPFRQITSFPTDVEGDMAFPSFNHIQTNNAANSPVGISAPTKKAKDVTFASTPGSA